MAFTTIRILPRRAGSEPLDITVFSNSPAEGELQRGDVILAINGRDASTLTHKQAQDSIKFGGGQVELLVSRPPSGASVRPLQPQSPTKAPPLPVHKTASIQIPIRRSSDHGPKIMPPPAFAGHQPKKITMNKFGGGTSNFGSNYGARAQQPGWSPQPSIYSQQYTPQPSMQEREATAPQYQQQYQSPPQQQYQQYQQPPQQQQQQYQPPPQQQYQAPPQQQSPRSPQYQPYSLNQPQKTSAATFSPSTPTSQYISPGMSQPDYVRSEDPVNDEVDYEYIPVSQRRNVFKDKQEKQPQINRSGRRRTYGSPGGAGVTQFGTDFSKGPTPAAVTVQQRPRPPPVVQVPVNAAPPPQDEPDTSSFSKNWSGTLKSSGGPRPWEQEQKEYVMPSMREQGQQQQSRGRPAPAVSPKPSRSPQPRKPAASPQRQIVVRSVPNDEAQQEQPPQDGAKAVHLQYNSPMGLYSNQNIEDTYNAQIGYPGQNTTSSTVSPQPKQGEYFDGSGMSHTMFAVDDSDEYLYQLLSEHKHLIGKTIEKNMAPKPNDYQAPVTQYVPIAQIHEEYQSEKGVVEGQPRYSKVEPPVRITPAEVLAQPPAPPPKPVTRPVVPPKPAQSVTPAGQESIQTENRSRKIQETVQVNESPPILNKEPPDDRTEQSVSNDSSINNVSTSTDKANDKVIDEPSDRSESGQNVDESVTLSLNNEISNNAEDKCVTVESNENLSADGNATDSKSVVDEIDSTKAESAPAVIDESSENSSTINDKLEQALESDLTAPVVEDSGKIEQSTDMKVDESKESTSEADSCIDSKSLREKGESDNIEVTGEINTEELGKNDETSSLKESHSVEEKEKSEPEPADSEKKGNTSNVEEKAEKVAEEQQNVSAEKPNLGEVKTEDQSIAETNNVDSTSDAKEPTVEKNVEETDGNIESKDQTINETITLEGEIVESNEDTKEMVEQVVLEQESVSTSNVDETVSGSQVEEEVVILLQDEDNQQEVTSKVEESVRENKADEGEKGEQQEASVVEKSETNDQSGETEPVEAEQSKTPVEETQDQQKETTAEETEAVVTVDEVQDEAASKEMEDSDSAMEKKTKKKERLDLSQFKQEKKAPGKLNTKKWET